MALSPKPLSRRCSCRYSSTNLTLVQRQLWNFTLVTILLNTNKMCWSCEVIQKLGGGWQRYYLYYYPYLRHKHPFDSSRPRLNVPKGDRITFKDKEKRIRCMTAEFMNVMEESSVLLNGVQQSMNTGGSNGYRPLLTSEVFAVTRFQTTPGQRQGSSCDVICTFSLSRPAWASRLKGRCVINKLAVNHELPLESYMYLCRLTRPVT